MFCQIVEGLSYSLLLNLFFGIFSGCSSWGKGQHSRLTFYTEHYWPDFQGECLLLSLSGSFLALVLPVPRQPISMCFDHAPVGQLSGASRRRRSPAGVHVQPALCTVLSPWPCWLLSACFV